jgi:hypothetical protein
MDVNRDSQETNGRLGMIYCFDIDGTICTFTDGEYEKALPYSERITKLNRLREEGHEVILFTARGSTTGIDWQDFTYNQLTGWGLKFDKLILGKPQADVFVDDLAVNSESFDWH